MGSKWTVRQLRRRLAREPSACASKDGTFITFISRSALGLRFERRDARLLPALRERMGLRRGVDSGHPIGVALSKIISATSYWPSPTRDCQNTRGQSFTRRSSIAFQLQEGDEDFPVSSSLICRRIGHAPRSHHITKTLAATEKLTWLRCIVPMLTRSPFPSSWVSQSCRGSQSLILSAP